jgi:transcriptional regulator with XRE-family HTH domain
MGSKAEKLIKTDTDKGSGFVRQIEEYLKLANWSKQELMAEVDLGETQLYRWARGDSIPRKSSVNRIASVLVHRLDEIHERTNKGDKFAYSDKIDEVVNILLKEAGYAGSVKGVDSNTSWYSIARNIRAKSDERDERRSWKLAYTEIPGLIRRSNQTAQPIGVVIDYAERIGQLMGIKTQWVELDWNELSLAIQEREVHAIAPFLMVLPERQFDYGFSAACTEGKFTISAITNLEGDDKILDLQDIQTNKFRFIYKEGDIGEWACRVLKANRNIEDIHFDSNEKVIAYIKSESSRNDGVKIFFSDSVTCKQLSEKNNLQLISVNEIKLSTHLAFAVHPDERRLIESLSYTIEMTEKMDIYI